MALTTRSSLLECIRGDGPEAWRDFHAVYTPFLLGLAKRMGRRGPDAEEVAQAVLVDLFQGRATFGYDRSRGRFRDYLKRVVVSRLSKLLRQARRAGTPTGDVPEPWADDLEQHWEEEYRQHILREALSVVRAQVEPRTYQAFDLYALQGAEAREVARFLEVSAGAVYTSKTRVLERLRLVMQELMDQ